MQYILVLWFFALSMSFAMPAHAACGYTAYDVDGTAFSVHNTLTMVDTTPAGLGGAVAPGEHHFLSVDFSLTNPNCGRIRILNVEVGVQLTDFAGSGWDANSTIRLYDDRSGTLLGILEQEWAIWYTTSPDTYLVGYTGRAPMPMILLLYPVTHASYVPAHRVNYYVDVIDESTGIGASDAYNDEIVATFSYTVTWMDVVTRSVLTQTFEASDVDGVNYLF